MFLILLISNHITTDYVASYVLSIVKSNVKLCKFYIFILQRWNRKHFEIKERFNRFRHLPFYLNIEYRHKHSRNIMLKLSHGKILFRYTFCSRIWQKNRFITSKCGFLHISTCFVILRNNYSFWLINISCSHLKQESAQLF